MQDVDGRVSFYGAIIIGVNKMHRLRSKILVSILILFSFLLFENQKNTCAGQNKHGPVCFRWAFCALTGPKNDRQLVPLAPDTMLKTGDQLKMFLQLKKKCFVYLIYHTGQDEVRLLFPYEIRQFTSDYKLLTDYSIPPGGMWFELDENLGQETFYLLASAQRLFKLEALLEKYRMAENVSKHELAKQVLDEIRKEKGRHRKLTTAAERPVEIGGSLRGVIRDKKTHTFDIDSIAIEVSTTNFYSRKFIIDHQ